MGKLAQGLLKRVYAAVRDCVDEWYYYGCLVPKIEAALMLGCYGRALGSKRDMMAQHMPNGGRQRVHSSPAGTGALARPLGLERRRHLRLRRALVGRRRGWRLRL